MAEEEVNYASVVIKDKKKHQTEAKLEEQIVYDEVRLHNKTVKPSDDTTVKPSDDTTDSGEILSEKEVGRRRCFQRLAFCLVAFCIISMLAIIVVIIYEKQDLKKQVQELQMKNNNLTDQVHMMQTLTIELNVSRAQWSINAYCPQGNDKKCKSCQDGWLLSASSCYAYNDAKPADQLSWEEARGNCKGKISDLTLVADDEEKKFVSGISSNISPTGSGITGYWIGLRAVEGKWKWINGSDMTNNTWINPPANNSQCVISVKDQAWIPVSCGNKNAWICEKKALSV